MNDNTNERATARRGRRPSPEDVWLRDMLCAAMRSAGRALTTNELTDLMPRHEVRASCMCDNDGTAWDRWRALAPLVRCLGDDDIRSARSMSQTDVYRNLRGLEAAGKCRRVPTGVGTSVSWEWLVPDEEVDELERLFARDRA
jgi:hypothetical protein